jgi:hypothetical protein
MPDDSTPEARRLAREAEIHRWKATDPKVQLHIAPGCSIAHACLQAQRLANQSDEPVIFEFNGIECVAVPGGNPELLAERQAEAQRQVPRVWNE